MFDILRWMLKWWSATTIPTIAEHLDIQYYVAPPRRGMFVPAGQRRLYEVRWRDGR